jgi:hypothetical protein
LDPFGEGLGEGGSYFSSSSIEGAASTTSCCLAGVILGVDYLVAFFLADGLATLFVTDAFLAVAGFDFTTGEVVFKTGVGTRLLELTERSISTDDSFTSEKAAG